jgi:hypothetical protein
MEPTDSAEPEMGVANRRNKCQNHFVINSSRIYKYINNMSSNSFPVLMVPWTFDFFPSLVIFVHFFRGHFRQVVVQELQRSYASTVHLPPCTPSTYLILNWVVRH